MAFPYVVALLNYCLQEPILRLEFLPERDYVTSGSQLSQILLSSVVSNVRSFVP